MTDLLCDRLDSSGVDAPRIADLQRTVAEGSLEGKRSEGEVVEWGRGVG